MDVGDTPGGSTASAVRALGDVARLRPPEAGTRAEAGERCGRIGSATVTGDLYRPV
ncbi:hypothetical protein GCM10010279_61100 [Streptomyces mutabilis]|nr:hypothetical protein GCM10010279_61100 [Streptomyces mutabilis]